MLSSTFYLQSYLQSGGWIPMLPLRDKLAVGDFCQIRSGRMRPLGNVCHESICNQIIITDFFPHNQEDWKLADGVRQVFCTTEQVSDDAGRFVEWTKQVLEFSHPGSFIFHATEPHSRLILNWSEFEQDVLLKLTQGKYSFRELYVVTAVVKLDSYSLAIASKEGAQLEMSAELRETDCYTLLNHDSSRAEQSKDMDTFEQGAEGPIYFFKAKKLVLQEAFKEYFIAKLLADEDMSMDVLANWMSADLINHLGTNDINLSNVLTYFTWADASLDDVQLLC